MAEEINISVPDPPKIVFESTVNSHKIILYEDGHMILTNTEMFVDRIGSMQINDDAFLAVLEAALRKRSKLNG